MMALGNVGGALPRFEPRKSLGASRTAGHAAAGHALASVETLASDTLAEPPAPQWAEAPQPRYHHA